MLATGTYGIGPSNTVTVGNGKAIHWGNDCGTKCGAGAGKSRKLVTAPTATCQRCIRLMALQVELDHEAAAQQLADELAAQEYDERRTVARAFLGTRHGVVLTSTEIEAAHAEMDLQMETSQRARARMLGRTIEADHADALEYEEILAFEKTMYRSLLKARWSTPETALEATYSCRNVDAAWEEPTDATRRYDLLLRKHGSAVPFLLKPA